MTDIGWYLYLNDHVALWHKRRPGPLRRLLQGLLLGWYWRPAKGEIYTLRIAGPEHMLGDIPVTITGFRVHP